MVRITPSSEVGALAPEKSSPVQERVFCARLRPFTSSQAPDANVAEPPKSPAEVTEVTTGWGTLQAACGGVAVALKVNGGRLTPATEAVTTTGPAAGPRVSVTAAIPSASVN